MKTGRFPLSKGHHILPQNQHFLLSTKMNGAEKRTLVIHKEYIVHTVVCQKAPLRLKQCRTAKKIKPMALSIIKLHLALVSQSVRKFRNFF